MRGSHSQILMWLPCPEPHTSHPRLCAIHQTRPTLVAVPLFTAFPVSYMHISRNNTSMRPPRFILPTLTEILLIPVVVLRVNGVS